MNNWCCFADMPLKAFLGLHRVSALQVDVRYPEVAIIMDSQVG